MQTPHSPFRSVALVVVAVAPLFGAGCESTDPCVQRQSACLDVVLLGKKDPVFYRNVAVRVTDAKNTELLPALRKDELRATAVAGVQDVLTFVLPDGFNAQQDRPPAEAIDALPDDAAKLAMLKQLRDSDPRAIVVTVEGTEVSGNDMTAVRWNSREDEDCFSTAQWLMQRYYRVGKNEYRATYAYLTTGKLCK